MKIIHIDATDAFTENMSYQENILPVINAKDGHDVTVIVTNHEWYHGKIVETDVMDKKLEFNVRLIRLKEVKVLFKFISRKVRKLEGMSKILSEIKPDIIFFHCPQSYELLTVSKYKKENPNTKIYVDNHADENNSAQNFVSKFILHKLFYRFIMKKALPFIDKVFYLSLECGDFLKKYYDVPEKIMEFYPLGGVVINEADREAFRNEKRHELGINEDDIVFIHSGKMDKLKKTREIIENFSKVPSEKLKLIIIGSIPSDTKESLMKLINKDNRIKYLGWKSSDELMKYICASDLYLQPGSQSATMQNAICCGTPVLFANVESHKPYMKGNCFSIDNTEEMESIFQDIVKYPSRLKTMSKNAYVLARELLDYEKLAAKLY